MIEQIVGWYFEGISFVLLSLNVAPHQILSKRQRKPTLMGEVSLNFQCNGRNIMQKMNLIKYVGITSSLANL